MTDPYAIDMTGWRMRMYLKQVILSPQRSLMVLADEDIERLPGDLPRHARELSNARSGDEARMAANAFLTASEEYLDR